MLASVKNMFLLGLLAASTTLAAPTPEAAPETSLTSANLSGPLEKRKQPFKCETHIKINTSTGFASNPTRKFEINIVNKPGHAIGKTYDWSRVGTWAATNPNYRIVIPTTTGLQFWIDGAKGAGANYGDNWRSMFTLHYGSQHWNSMQCPTWKYTGASENTGLRVIYDLWCEFDC
ncbi:hypothetical protein BJ508DRAFT_325321 [Ascobolus immersus RN42]|uniref:Uncharacterized protein n=1 Tax=Ascobolus immersus RN42 TaxID=1160509 RepID=A0A3N4I933_ASCIM|nr:hypothetical protein BJ508DRAFT_325321 [Ascobolus immersus RN42]